MNMGEQDFEQLLQFIEDDTGIRLPEANYRQVKHFVVERLNILHLDLETYLARLTQQKREHAQFLDAVTINETYFFREEKHFKIIESLIFPQYRATLQTHLPLWSAACSTGEEAVSLAALAETCWG